VDSRFRLAFRHHGQVRFCLMLRDAFDRGMAEMTASGEIRGWVEDFKKGRYGNAPFEGDYWTLDDPLEALD